MRILHLVENFYPKIGGAQYVAGQLASAQATRGDAIEVVVTGPRGELPVHDYWNEIPVHRFDFRTALETRNVEKILEAISGVKKLRKAFSPDVTHVHLWGPGAALHLQTNQISPAPWVVTVHVPVPKPVHGSSDNLGNILRTANAVVAISESIRQNVLTHNVDPARISLIYNAVHMPARQFSSLPWNPPLLLVIGRIVPEKGFDLAIDALACLKGWGSTARLVIVGDGPDRPKLERQAKDLGIAERTEFLGWVAPDEVPGVLNRSTILLVPSRWDEPFGLVAVEAALAGRPVVAARIGGLSEVVLDGRTGLLVPPNDPDALAASIFKLLNNKTLATQLGLAGAENAKERFSLGMFLANYDGVYSRIRSNPEKAASILHV